MSIYARRGMMTSTSDARRLPLPPPVTPSQLRAIEAGLIVAWARTRGAVDTSTADEVTLNATLADRLNDLLAEGSVPGFDQSTFETIERGSEHVDASGNKLENRPDLRFRAQGSMPFSKSEWALFAECKIADPSHPMSRYCGDGLLRFVDGRYAWAVALGLMIGYARSGYTLPNHIEEHLSPQRLSTYGLTDGKLTLSNGSSAQGWESRHRRAVPCPTSYSGRVPNIRVVHIWLNANKLE